MASRVQHQGQWLHNRAFLASIIQQPGNSDWMTTVAFYTALHAVQVLLCVDGNDRATTHESRREVLISVRRYDKVWPDYKALYDASRVSRYDCTGWLDVAVVREELIRNRLLRLEQQVVKLGKMKVELPDLLPPSDATRQAGST